jgi:putative peptidoglycan lipid II flippase
MDRPPAKTSFIKAGSTVGLAAGLSRLLGFARDVGLANLFGAGPISDALLIALRLPNLTRRVLGEGGLHSGLIPILVGLRHQGDDQARRFASDVLLLFSLIMAGLCALVQLVAIPVVTLLGAPDDTAPLAGQWLIWAFPMVAGSGFAAIASALLAVQQRFALAAWSGVIVNGVIVAVLVWLSRHPLDPTRSAGWIAGLSGLSGLIQGLVLIGAMQMSPLAPRWSLPKTSPTLRRFILQAGPGLMVAASSQLAFVVLISQAGSQSGLVSALYFADRVTQLPFGFIAAILAIVVLPLMSRHAQAKDRSAFSASLGHAMGLSLALALPAATGLVMLAEPITHVLFGHGAFDNEAQRLTSEALAIFALSLPALALARVGAQGFFAFHRSLEPLIATLAGLLTVVIVILLTKADPKAGTYALAFSCGAGVDMLAGLLLLHIRLEWRPDRAMMRMILATLMASAVMMVVVSLIPALLHIVMPAKPDFTHDMLVLLAQCLGGMAVYGLGLKLSGLFGAIAPLDSHDPVLSKPE